jgi:hypothetical protein
MKTAWALALAAFAGVARAQPEMQWHTIDGGGGASAGAGNLLLIGVVGQPDVGTMTGGSLRLSGGFWAVDSEPCEADINGDGIVDFNDLLEFLSLYNAGSPLADFNLDGIIDFNDFLEYLNFYNLGC